MKGISAVIAAILMLMITMALAGVAYFYISGIFASKTTLIEGVGDANVAKSGANCDITWKIKNTGTATVTVTVSSVNEACTTDPTASQNILGGETMDITAHGCTQNRNHVYKAVGPSNTVNLIAFCA